MARQLRLDVRNFKSPVSWRWLLTDEGTGQPLADHQLDLAAASDNYKAFIDLYRHLRWHAAPDRRTASEAEIVARVGTWAGREVLGKAITAALARTAPATLRVVLPPEAGFVVSWPLELAYVGGKPLAARGDIAVAYDLGEGPPAAGPAGTSEQGQALRMLALFSLPTATSTLALRRERYELARLIRRIVARQQRRIELSVVQYGATRERLAHIAEAGDGWDLLHLSGHGGRGQFLLEKPDGSPDPVDSDELVAMLAPLRRRTRLAVVSACDSAAATTAETLRWMGLNEQAKAFDHQAAGDAAEGTQTMTGVARALARELGCAVVAMRYPVTDDFAIAFTEDLYERLLESRDSHPGSHGQPLGTALARAVMRVSGSVPSPARPALSVATPVLLGSHAAGLVVDAPRGSLVLDPARVHMGQFPAEPERFVGRSQAMARASAILAPGSGRPGVLLHGMAGSGKTACALELAYRHSDSFAITAFWQAPESDDEFGEALTRLAAALDAQLGPYGFAMSGKITTAEEMEAFTPRLQRLLEDNAVLLVLDNLETILTSAGIWRDPRWERLIRVLTGHTGESRVILTSRIPPHELNSRVLALQVHALDLGESIALARELPGLRGLLHAGPSPLRDAHEDSIASDRDLVRRVLRVVQGHPKLMELADASALAGRAQLAAQLASAEEAADGQALGAFFRDGSSRLDAAQFLNALSLWTATTLAALPEPAQLMAQFLACLEDRDRQWFIVQANWDDLWRQLTRTGGPPDPEPLLEALAVAAIIQTDPVPASQDRPALAAFTMHPGVAEAVRANVSLDTQAAADGQLAAYWEAVARHAMRREEGEAGRALLRASLAASTYLLRLKDWNTASELIDQALQRVETPAGKQAFLPALRAITNAVRAPHHLAHLATSLSRTDPAESERLFRSALEQAVATKNFALATACVTGLMNLLRDAGKLHEALELADQKITYTRLAGLGPWSQLLDAAMRLQILAVMGEHQQVLGEVHALQEKMDKLPPASSARETVTPWNVRELILNVGFTAAMRMSEWQQALDLNAANLASMRARSADPREITRHRLNDSAPLLHLGRLDQAEQLLKECQKVFEADNDLVQLAQVLGSRADLASKRGDLSTALSLEQTAIRFSYTRPEARRIAVHHNNLAGHLREAGSDLAGQRAHRLAAAYIFHLAAMPREMAAVCAVLASEAHRYGVGEELPGTLKQVIRIAEQTDGVRLGHLITALQPDTRAAATAFSQTLHAIIAQENLRRWEPVISLAIAAISGDSGADGQLKSFLEKTAQDARWGPLATVLGRILNGERDQQLLGGMDPSASAIAGEVLARLTLQPTPASGQEP